MIAVFFGVLSDLSKNNVSIRLFQSPVSKVLHTYTVLCAPISILFVTCFRYGVGYDYFPTYVEDYYRFKNHLDIHSDAGFQLFYYISQHISDNPQWLFIITGAIVVLGFYISSYLISGSATFSLLLFFFSGAYIKSISMIAQYIAISLLLLSFASYFYRVGNNRKLALSVALAIAAPFFHVSAFFPAIILVILYLTKSAKNKTIFYVSTFIPLVVLVFQNIIEEIIYYFIDKTRFSVYVDSQFVGIESKSILYIELFIFMMMWGILLSRYKQCSRLVMCLLLLESLSLSSAILQSIPLMLRITFYFSAFNIIGMPLILKQVNNKIRRYGLGILLLILLVVWFFLYPYPKNTDGFLPYAFVFNPSHLYY